MNLPPSCLDVPTLSENADEFRQRSGTRSRTARIDRRLVFRHDRTPMKSDFRFRHKLRVRFAETDLQGIVFNGNYLTYYDVGWTEYLREVGFQYKDLIELDADTVLVRTTMDFKSPARFDEILEVCTRISSIGNTSIVFDFEIYPEWEERLIGSASSVYVCINPKTLQPVRVPDVVRERVGKYEGKDFGASSKSAETNL